MVFSQNRITYLIQKAHEGAATQEELGEMLQALNQADNELIIASLNAFYGVTEDAVLPAEATHLYSVAAEVLATDKIHAGHLAAREQHSRRSRLLIFYKTTAVAATLVLLLGGLWLWKPWNVAPRQLAHHNTPHTTQIQPGKNGAVLTLSDGRQVVLDSLGNGVVAAENGAAVVYKNGSLVYDAATPKGAAAVYNTIATPRGRQFSLTLPDGTRVWLNAVSSLKYPVAFTGTTREVTLTGEAYFEVAANKQMPFIVKNERAEVEVLGTAFNMMCYDEEPVAAATLVTGAVRVKHGNQATLLQPGQQLVAGGATWKVERPDIEGVLAWKNGLFRLTHASLATVMRQVERWYDVTVVYPNGVPDIPLEGFIQREKDIAAFLEIIKASGVRCRLENNTIIINH